MINQAFEAAAKTEAHSPMLPMSVCVALSQGYIGYDLQNALREELLSRGINKPVATLVTRSKSMLTIRHSSTRPSRLVRSLPSKKQSY